MSECSDLTGDDDISIISQENEVQIVDSSTDGKAQKLLKSSVRKALLEFRCKLENAILSTRIFSEESSTKRGRKSKGESTDTDESLKNLTLKDDIRDISLWGVPLLPSKAHEGTDVILLKFLRARDYKVSEAYELLKKTLKWRKEYGADRTLEEDFGSNLENVAYLDSTDKDGHPLIYIIYQAFSDKALYENFFGNRKESDKFIRWRVQSMEKAIRNLSFKDGGVHCLVIITDLKTSPGPAMKELRTATKKAMSLIQDYYPEIVLQNIIVNTPFWYYAYHTLFDRMLTSRMRNKYVFARPSRVPRTLFKYIAPENIPVQYGGLKREDDKEFSPDDQVTTVIVQGGSVETILIHVKEPAVTVVWDITTVDWDVTYKEEFVPDDECSYKIAIREEKKMVGSVRSSFYINEPGKILLTVSNGSFKRKKLFYRFKIKPTLPIYVYWK